MLYPLATSTWNEEEHLALQRVISSGNFTMGKEVENFEKDFSHYVGSKYAVMVNSGSSANLAMIASLMFTQKHQLQPGDEVLVPAVSWSTTYYPLQQYGLNIKFIDIDKKTLNMDLTELSSAITEKTKVILAVNLLGNPNDFNKINTLIGDRKIILLEDNCESLGAMFEDKQAGTFGEMGTFSFFFSHHISTMEGGMIVTNNEELYHILLCLRAHGWTRNLPQYNHVCGEKSLNFFEEQFHFVLPGYNLRPIELSGAVGKEQLKKLPDFIEMRRNNASLFQELFHNHPWLNIQQETGTSSWFGFAFILQKNAPITRQELVEKLLQAQIEVRPIVAGNFAKNDVLKWFNYSLHNALTNADYIDKNGFFVGNHHYSLDKELHYLRELLV